MPEVFVASPERECPNCGGHLVSMSFLGESSLVDCADCEAGAWSARRVEGGWMLTPQEEGGARCMRQS